MHAYLSLPDRRGRRRFLPPGYKALSEGWELYGPPTYAYDGHNKKMKAGQAVTRVAKEQPYDPDKKLVEF